MKDVYSLPCIDETFDCLSGSNICTSLNLKSGYWHVKLSEASKPLTTFTMEALGFYEYVCMPFSLINAPATF